MTAPLQTAFETIGTDAIAGLSGRIALLVDPEGGMGQLARRVNRVTKGAVQRLAQSDAFKRLKPGEGQALHWPQGLAAEAVLVVKLAKRPDAAAARKAGATIAGFNGSVPLTVLAGGNPGVADIVYGLLLRAYAFDAYRTPEAEKPLPNRTLTVAVPDAEAARAAAAGRMAVVEGVFLTRDLVSEPANVLTTLEFASRLEGLRDLGVEVEVLDDDALEQLGMRTLLAVGQGSESPSRVVVMHWKGAEAPPLALVGKGVVFDTGGISIKPALGMEEMVMDMGGAGVVAGAMHALARRKAKANVVGLVGLVENMPDGRAQRPGDVVKSMKGDTVEVINTDAEGRLVLADVLWYAQERFQPAGMIDLATLTGAIIIALGHENAGVFSNDEGFAEAFLKAAREEGEGAWRMPLGAAYDKKLKSRIADIANVGGRDGGAVTAAQFLKRFVKDEVPWIHLDIAGVAYVSRDSDFAPKGATGWGVAAIDRLVRDRYEG
ncbi:leucyl aminopeptidase [soil metagenome]